MNFKHGLVLSAAVLAVAGCGGSSDGNKSPRDPYIEFRVNGVLNPSEVNLTWVEWEGADTLGFCDTTRYDNAQSVLDGAESSYCDKSVTSITFSIRYTNATYEPVDVSYDGLGFEIHIAKYDDTKTDFKGDEIWNSSYYAQRLVVGARLADPSASIDDFDPDEPASVTLKASESLPSYSGFYSVTFEADQIYDDGGDGRVGYDPATAESQLLTNPTVASCDWIPQVNDTRTAYRYIRCFGDELLPKPGLGTDPVKFIATVSFNFSGVNEETRDILITLNPPE